MHARYRLTNTDLFQALEAWNDVLGKRVFVAACGGTALTLYGYKESTKDVDLLVPDPAHYKSIIKAITKLGYKQATGNGYKHPDGTWIFDLFRGQTIFQTELLDPVQTEGKHRVIREYEHVIIACVNPDDLIISKMFRGTQVDVKDSVLMIKSEDLDLAALAKRYRETASYYHNPDACKTNLKYLIDELKLQKVDATPLREISNKWTP